jgi:hypothetical protein
MIRNFFFIYGKEEVNVKKKDSIRNGHNIDSIIIFEKKKNFFTICINEKKRKKGNIGVLVVVIKEICRAGRNE